MRRFICRALLLCFAFSPALAAVPSSISYQAYLTDRDGTSQSGDVLITFSIYTVEAGGSPLWTDNLLIVADNGLVSTELGRSANPFPPGLFETPLWLGITVESDMEMIPRRPLTTVGFSFKAEDADSLQGKSAADLDQSDHVDDVANPHAVSAGQVGAASQVGLDAHTTDIANPHAVSATQAGALSVGGFMVHADDASAHHERYNDAEAVAAMGAQDAANPLNHTRYTDEAALAAVLAGDGSGSGVDADLVDGVELGTALGVRLMMGEESLGRVIQYETNEDIVNGGAAVVLLTETGLLFKALYNTSYTPTLRNRNNNAVYFAEPDCTGQAYVFYGYENQLIPGQGIAFLSGNPLRVFYIPKGAVYANVQVASGTIAGTNSCFSSLTQGDAWPAYENNSAETGLPDVIDGILVLN